jgi:hypothetical protein
MHRRVLTYLVSVAIGVLFAAGLFVHGRAGGGLLLITVAVLIALAMTSWGNTRRQGRPIRIAVILVITAIAVAKLVK